MFEHSFFLWFAMLFPLIFSAGPANITMASFGGRFGLYKLIPFILGINLIVLIQTASIGFGAEILLEKYPIVFKYLKYIGSIYLIYLAVKLIKSSKTNTNKATSLIPSFFDGVILQSLNVKVITITTIMFSQFLNTSINQTVQIIMLSIGMTAMTTVATITWAFTGAVLMEVFISDKSVKLQGYFFGTMLIIVAIWMLLY